MLPVRGEQAGGHASPPGAERAPCTNVKHAVSDGVEVGGEDQIAHLLIGSGRRVANKAKRISYSQRFWEAPASGALPMKLRKREDSEGSRGDSAHAIVA